MLKVFNFLPIIRINMILYQVGPSIIMAAMVGNTFLIWTLTLEMRMTGIPNGMHMDIIEIAPSTFMLMPNSPPPLSSACVFYS